MDHYEENPYREAGAPKLRRSVAAFLDILGYKSQIKAAFSQGRSHEELQKLRRALDLAYRHLKEAHCPGERQRFQARGFTDNLVIGYPISDGESGSCDVLAVVNYLSYLQAELARQGYFLRGALAVGELYMDEDIVFGPSLLEAYDAEQCLAKYPRVILCKSATDTIDPTSFPWLSEGVVNLLKDSDGCVFIDYLKATVMLAYPDDRPFCEILDDHRTQICARLKEFHECAKVLEKYEWAANYHNFFCRRYPQEFTTSDHIQLQESPVVFPSAWTE